MYTARNSRRSQSLVRMTAAVLFLLAAPLAAQFRVYDFPTSQGMKVKIIQDAETPYIHAELLVYFDVNSNYLSSSAIPYFILCDLFEENWQRSNSRLSGHLQRMGDVFDFQLSSDCVRITVDFLPGRESTFAAFLKEFFTYAPFSLKKFNQIKNNFWEIFRKNRDWKGELANMLAHHHLLADNGMGRTLINSEQIRMINLAQVNSFYQKNFRPDHTLLVIRGSVNPYQMLGVLKNEMQFSMSPSPLAIPLEKTVPNNNRKVFLVPVESNDPPTLYFFDVAPAFDDPRFLSFFIIQYALFHYPFGRVYRTRGSSALTVMNYGLTNEVISHRGFSVIRSSSQVNAADIESVIAAIDQEKRRLPSQQIRRDEFANALNYLLGKTRIDSTRVETEVEVEIGKFIAENKPVYVAPSPDMFQRISFENLGQVIDDYFAPAPRSGGRERGVVVIVGNEEQVLNSWKGNRPEIVRFIE